MQDEEYYNRHGMGRNVSCDNWECENYRKKIGRTRGCWCSTPACPICHEIGYMHSYNCTVSKDGIMNCNCHLRVGWKSECHCKLCWKRYLNRKK